MTAKPHWITSGELKSGAENAPLRKAIDGDVETLPDARRVRFIISTSDVDRDNDIVEADGWDTASFRKNPVVLWAHSHYDLPIGRCVELGPDQGRLAATVEFATHTFAETVYQLVKGGFLRATSVGFRALEWSRDEQRGGVNFKRQELLEFSIVPVPANQFALVAASASGIDLAPLKAWVSQAAKAIKAAEAAEAAIADPEPVQDQVPGPPEPARGDEGAVPAGTTQAEPVVEPGAVQAALEAVSVEKRGRVLSASNESLLRSAHTCAMDCMTRVKQVLDSVEAAQATEDEPDEDEPMEMALALSAVAALELDIIEADVLDIDISEESGEEEFDFSAEDVRSILRDAVASGMSGAVRDATRLAMAQLRGRVD